MTSLVVLFAAGVLASMPAHHAATPSYSNSHGSSSSHSSFHAAAPAHHAALPRSYEQAVHHQMEYQRHLMQQHQRGIHEQIRAEVLHHQNLGQPHAAAIPSGGSNSLTERSYAARSSGPAGYYGGYYHQPYHSYYHHSYPHHVYHHRTYRHYQTWPGTQDHEYAAILRLKQTLDQIEPGDSPLNFRAAIEQALMRVVEVYHTPSIGAIDRLASELNRALADRTSPTIDTATIALALRGGLNFPALITAERVEVIRELENALRQGGVAPMQIMGVASALRNVEHQEIARR